MKQIHLYVVLTIVMLIWGVNLPAVKFLTTQMGPVTMTSMRILVAAITVFIILYFMKLVRWPTHKEMMYILVGSLLNVVFHHYFISVGISKTSGTNAGLILGAGPMLTAILGTLLLKMVPSKWQWCGFVMGLIGVSLTVVVGNGGTTVISIGDLFVFISILAQVLSFLVISKAAKTLDPRLLTAYMFLVGSIVLFIMSLIQEPGEIVKFVGASSVFLWTFIASGMIATAIGHMLYNFAVGQVGPAKSAIFINLNTVFALLGSVIMLNETISSYHIIGLILIVIGVILGSGAAEELWIKKYRKLQAIQENL